MALNPDVVESVTASNFKVIGDSPAFYGSLAMGDAVAHQRRTHVIAENVMGRLVKDVAELDPSEAVSILKATSGNDLAQQLAQLTAAISAVQQGVKAAQTTPPETGK